jgi:hypothetical protein
VLPPRAAEMEHAAGRNLAGLEKNEVH